MQGLPITPEGARAAVASENLRAVAATTDDPDLLLGLAYLAPAGDAVRGELGGRAVGADAACGPPAAVIGVLMDGPDETTIAALLESDADNALGHYMLAHLAYRARREPDALRAFARATACTELRLYENRTSGMLFKALDALNLRGRDRVGAVAWMATRFTNACIEHVLVLPQQLAEMATQADASGRETISDMLLTLAGHLHRTNGFCRMGSEQALAGAFRLKAELAAEDSPRRYGYATATSVLRGMSIGWPHIADQKDLRRIVPFVASRVYRAFHVVDRAATDVSPSDKTLPASTIEAYEKAQQAEAEAAHELIDAATENPDETVGAYLRGVVERAEEAGRRWATPHTHVELAMHRHPRFFKAALRFEDAMDAVNAIRMHRPREKNLTHMMELAGEIMRYAFEHEYRLPRSLDELLAENRVEPADLNSRLTSRPYVYVGAGQLPRRHDERLAFILLYDDSEEDGKLQAVMAIPAGIELSPDELKRRLDAQPK